MRIKERHIPEGYKLITDNQELSIQVYKLESDKVIIAMCFVGKALKPTWHYRFKDDVRLQMQIKDTIDSKQSSLDYKNKRKQEQKEAINLNDVAVGDVFRCSWGYDQTNIDYYQVTSVRGLTMTVCQIGSMSEEDGFLQGKSVPALNHFIGKPMTKRIQQWSKESEPYFKVNSFSNAYRMKPVAIIANTPIFEESHWTAYA